MNKSNAKFSNLNSFKIESESEAEYSSGFVWERWEIDSLIDFIRISKIKNVQCSNMVI